MLFDDKIRDLIAHAYQHAPTIRAIMDGVGVTPNDIQSAADLPKIPVLPKDRLIELQREHPPFGGLLTIDPAEVGRIYVSPGPIFDPQPPAPTSADDPRVAPFRAVGFMRGDRVLNTFAYHLTPAGMMLDDGLRAVGATVIPSGPGNTETQLTLITSLNVTGYVGTPSFLAILLDKAAEQGIAREVIPIKKALFSAEPYTPSQRARFEDEYGMTTASAYGTADLGFFGYTAPNVTGFCLIDDYYVEICDPDTGQPVEAGAVGEIVVTTLNYTYPLIRFGTGDLGALAPQTDPACAGAQQLTGLFGRSGDAIKVRGMFLHPNQILAAKARVPGAQSMQAVITRVENRDVVTVLVELKPGTDTTLTEDAVKAHVQSIARLRVDEVVIVGTGEIDPAARPIRDERVWG